MGFIVVLNFLLQAALSYAASGKPVFPCRVKDKAQLIPGGFKAASKDTEQLRLWWKKWPRDYISIIASDVIPCKTTVPQRQYERFDK